MPDTLFDTCTQSAVLSPCGLYRYHLSRQWDSAKPNVLFCMLNPSTADASIDDPTIRRCIGYAKSWGYGGLEVVNLFAFRATDPRALMYAANPIGIDNDAHIRRAAKQAARVVVAWGAGGTLGGRYSRVLAALMQASGEVHCLGITKDGSPRHPLYCRADLLPVRYEGKA